MKWQKPNARGKILFFHSPPGIGRPRVRLLPPRTHDREHEHGLNAMSRASFHVRSGSGSRSESAKSQHDAYADIHVEARRRDDDDDYEENYEEFRFVLFRRFGRHFFENYILFDVSPERWMTSQMSAAGAKEK